MRIYGLWHGGSSYSAPYVADDVEVFDSIDAALEACRTRMYQGHWAPQDFQYLNRAPESTLTPCVEGSSMHVFYVDPTHSPDPYPDAVIERDGDTEDFHVSPA